MFNVYFYMHGQTVSVAVATNQLTVGGCKTAEESSTIAHKISTHNDLQEAIQTAKRSCEESSEDWWDVSELFGDEAANSGRTHDGSPVLYRITAENSDEYGYDYED